MDESLNRKIVALMAMTTDRGCTEEEALAAAKKVQNLLNQHQLTLSDIEIRNSETVRDNIETGRKARGPMEYVCSSIAYFTDTKCWMGYAAFGNMGQQTTYNWFGFKHDVEIAKYIYKVCEWAIIWEWEDYKKTSAFQNHYNKNHAKKSFEAGITASLSRKLRQMKDAQRNSNISSGRDLVVVKKPVIEAAFAELNLPLRKSKAVGHTINDPNAYHSGKAAGERVNINTGVSGKSTSLID